jgi:hypothetical protein
MRTTGAGIGGLVRPQHPTQTAIAVAATAMTPGP